MRLPFVGEAYSDRSPNLNAQRCVNMYPVLDQKEGKSVMALYGTPGLDLFSVAGDSATRGIHVFGDNIYQVAGNTLYEVKANGVVTEKGTLVSSTGLVGMADNGAGSSQGQELIIVDGQEGYIYDLSADTFTQIASVAFPVANVVTFIDGYFIVNVADSGSFMISGLYDGTSWAALDIKTAEKHPDNLINLINNHGELWALGKVSTEVFYNSGNADFPFDRINGAFIERGLAGRWGLGKLDNSIQWVAEDSNGGGVIVRAEGYNTRVISTRAIEYQISQFPAVSDVETFSYVQEGHPFQVWNFPSGNATFVFDASTGMWHERAYRDPVTGDLGRHRANTYAYFNGKHIVGDYENGNLYEMKMDTYTDNGDPIARIRTARHLYDQDMKTLFHDRIDLDMELGVGLTVGQGSDPQVMLNYSDDGGHSWSNERWTTAGKKGEYGARAVWRALGRSRDRIYQMQITDPVKIAIIAASLQVRRGGVAV